MTSSPSYVTWVTASLNRMFYRCLMALLTISDVYRQRKSMSSMPYHHNKAKKPNLRIINVVSEVRDPVPIKACRHQLKLFNALDDVWDCLSTSQINVVWVTTAVKMGFKEDKRLISVRTCFLSLLKYVNWSKKGKRGVL